MTLFSQNKEELRELPSKISKTFKLWDTEVNTAIWFVVIPYSKPALSCILICCRVLVNCPMSVHYCCDGVLSSGWLMSVSLLLVWKVAYCKSLLLSWLNSFFPLPRPWICSAKKKESLRIKQPQQWIQSSKNYYFQCTVH